MSFLTTANNQQVTRNLPHLPQELKDRIIIEVLRAPDDMSLECDPIAASMGADELTNLICDFASLRIVSRRFNTTANEAFAANQFLLQDELSTWARCNPQHGRDTIEHLPKAVRMNVKRLIWVFPTVPFPRHTYEVWLRGTFPGLVKKIGDFVNLERCEMQWRQNNHTHAFHVRAFSHGVRYNDIDDNDFNNLPHTCVLSIPGIPKARELEIAAHLGRCGVGAEGREDLWSRFQGTTFLTHLDNLLTPTMDG